MPFSGGEAPRAAFLERMLAAVPGGVVYISPQGIVELINDEALRLVGATREQVLGKGAMALGLELGAEDGQPLAPEARPFLRVLRTGEVFEPRTLSFHMNGRRGWVIVRAAPLAVEDGAPPGVIASVLDITDRVLTERRLAASEERWRTIAANLPDQVVITDERGVIVFSNRYVPPLTEELVLGRLCWDFITEERRAEWQAHFDEAVRTRRAVRFDTMGVSAHRAVAWYETVLVPLEEEDVVRRVVVLARDVTERRRILARVAEHDRLATLGLVAASVAHEIMNPLTYVLVNLELVTSGRSPDATRSKLALEAAREGALRMQQIVRDLRSLGRTTTEELFYVELRAVIETAVRLAGPELAHVAEVRLELEGAPAVLASESQLCQVFINLLVNAAQAVRDRSVRRIVVRTVSDAPGFVGVAVEDSGPGVPEAQRDVVFAPFYTTKPQGTGLGLSITRDILNRLGGRVEVASPAGGGATFTVWLPTGSRPPAVRS